MGCSPSLPTRHSSSGGVARFGRGDVPPNPADLRHVQEERSNAIQVAEQLLKDGATTKFRDKYVRASLVSYGATARLLSAVNKFTDQRVACKVISKESHDPDRLRRRVIKEIAMQKHVEEHPNCVKILEVFEDEHSYYLIMEFCSGGELFDHIVRNKANGSAFTERQAAEMMRSLLMFLAHCHSRGVVHIDIKPENIVFDSDGPSGVLKVIDFGLSEFCLANEDLHDKFGTVRYCSPEMANDRCGQKTDVWSCGVVMYHMLCGRPPFAKRDDHELLEAIKRKPKVRFPGFRWASISLPAKQCIRLLLNPDPNQRPTAAEALQIPWLKEAAPDNTIGFEIVQQLQEFASQSLLRRLLLGLVAKHLSGYEANKLVHRFHVLDNDGNGRIEYSEMAQAVRRVVPELCEEEIQKVFQALDIDLTGTVEVSEFFAAMLQIIEPGKREYLAHRSFQSLDREGSGYISKKALHKALQHTHPELLAQGSDELSNQFEREFEALDKNGDGVLSFDEFRSVLLRAGNDGENEGRPTSRAATAGTRTPTSPPLSPSRTT